MDLPVVIIQTAFLGDLILTMPLINHAIRLFQEGKIIIVIRQGYSSLFNGFPNRVVVVEDDKKKFLPGSRSFRKVKELHPEIALLPHRSARSTLFALATGAKMRVGFEGSGFSFLLTHKVPYVSKAHEAERVLSLLKPFNHHPTLSTPWFEFLPFKEGEMQEKWSHVIERPYIMVFPFTNWETKNWGDDRWAYLANLLSGYNVNILISGTRDKLIRSERILSACRNSRVINITGKTELPDLIFLIKHSLLIISGDSSPVHIASSLSVPVVAIYGPTVPENGFGPLAPGSIKIGLHLSCRPCSPHGPSKCPLGHHRCMKEVTPEMVAEPVVNLLRIRGAL